MIDERFRASPFLQGQPFQQVSSVEEKKTLGEDRPRSYGLDLDDIAARVMNLLVVHNREYSDAAPPQYDDTRH